MRAGAAGQPLATATVPPAIVTTSLAKAPRGLESSGSPWTT
jgi:hypothetical protein